MGNQDLDLSKYSNKKGGNFLLSLFATINKLTTT
jgi:hypothetical protein